MSSVQFGSVQFMCYKQLNLRLKTPHLSFLQLAIGLVTCRAAVVRWWSRSARSRRRPARPSTTRWITATRSSTSRTTSTTTRTSSTRYTLCIAPAALYSTRTLVATALKCHLRILTTYVPVSLCYPSLPINSYFDLATHWVAGDNARYMYFCVCPSVTLMCLQD